METFVLVGGIAMACSFACLTFGMRALGASVRAKKMALAVRGETVTVPGLIAWRLRNGVGVLFPLSRRLLGLKRVRCLADELCAAGASKGAAPAPDAAVSVFIAGLAILFIMGLVVSGGVIAPCALVVCAVVVAIVLAGSSRDKREEAVREEVPGALESMSACFGSGFTLLQTFGQVASEVPGALGDVFARCAHILETGGSADQALRELREGAHASELAFVAVALDVQHQNGGTLRQVLDAASDSVKGELALRRSLRVQTAQAKLSARVVVVMPFILVAAFSLASPDFLAPFFQSVAGYALLALAIIMQVSGIVLVRRALSVDGVS